MPRTTKQAAPERSADDRLQTLEGKMDALTAVLERVADEMRVIRDVASDLHECFEWAVQNDKFRCESQHVMRITSMAKDPCDPEWDEKLNAVPSAELERQRAAVTASAEPPPANPGRQPELF